MSRPPTTARPRCTWPRSTFTLPRKPMTKGLAGCSKISLGLPTCSMCPRYMMATRSATSKASSWSWVTNTLVTWISSCRRRSHSRSSWRTLASSAPDGSSRRSAPLGTSRLTLSSARNLSKCLVTRVIRMPIRSEYHRTRPDEERELRALLGAEHPVQPVERAHGRLPHALRALDPRPSRLGGPGRVEAVLGEQVGERRRHPPVVDRSLRALGLELVQDARQLARLRLVQAELEGEEAQRPPHAEGGGAEEEARRGRDPGRRLLPRGTRVGAAARPVRSVMMHHGSLSSRRALRAGGCSRAGPMPRAVDPFSARGPPRAAPWARAARAGCASARRAARARRSPPRPPGCARGASRAPCRRGRGSPASRRPAD